MSKLKNGLLIILIITISMTKLETAKGRIYEGNQKNDREMNKLNYQSLQTRHHNHFLHKKHHKCNYERSYHGQSGTKKLSRYPTLDKIVYRLDKAGDRPDKAKLGSATSTNNPFDEWKSTPSGLIPFLENFTSNVYAFHDYGERNGTSAKVAHGAESLRDETFADHFRANARGTDSPARSSVHINPDFSKGKDNSVYNHIDEHFSTVITGFMQDHTTSSPWENEQHDISSRAEGYSKDSTYTSSIISTPLPSLSNALKLGQFPFWSISKLVSKSNNLEDRKKYTNSGPYVAAHEHYEQVLRMGDCHTPREKVIRVHEVHPDPSKSYSPSCTILHQCAEDTGCCRDLKQVCKPKNTTKVELYFFQSCGFQHRNSTCDNCRFSKLADEERKRKFNLFQTTTLGKPQTVEKLHFINHTECECQKRTDESMPQDAQFQKNSKDNMENVESREAKKVKCNCPEKYSVRFFHNESCICDCFDKQDECLILKKGKIHFSYRDKLFHQSHEKDHDRKSVGKKIPGPSKAWVSLSRRKLWPQGNRYIWKCDFNQGKPCIQQGLCRSPSCEYGPYIRRFGRCPNRSEKYNFRWNKVLSYRALIT